MEFLYMKFFLILALSLSSISCQSSGLNKQNPKSTVIPISKIDNKSSCSKFPKPYCVKQKNGYHTVFSKCGNPPKQEGSVCHEGHCIAYCTQEYKPSCGESNGKFGLYSNDCVRAKKCAKAVPMDFCTGKIK